MVDSSFKLADFITASRPKETFSVFANGLEFRFRGVMTRSEQKSLEDEVRSCINTWRHMQSVKSWPSEWPPFPDHAEVLAECAIMKNLCIGVFHGETQLMNGLSDAEVLDLVRMPAFGQTFGDKMNASMHTTLTEEEINQIISQKKGGKATRSI